MYVCVSVFMCACMYVCVCVRICVMYICVHVYIFACMNVCLYSYVQFAVWDAAAGKCGEGETGARYKVHTSLSPPPLPLLNTNPLSICLLFIWDSSELLPLAD